MCPDNLRVPNVTIFEFHSIRSTDSEIGEQLEKYTNVPGQNVLKERLVQQLLIFSKENLHEELVPSAVVIVDALP